MLPSLSSGPDESVRGRGRGGTRSRVPTGRARGGRGRGADGSRGGGVAAGRPGRRAAAATTDAGGVNQLDEEPANPMKNLFSKELTHMMYGYGDDVAPLPETVEVVEEMLLAYITDLTHKLIITCAGKPRPAKDDLMYILRKDHRKLSRVKELLKREVELKDARKAADTQLLDSCAADG